MAPCGSPLGASLLWSSCAPNLAVLCLVEEAGLPCASREALNQHRPAVPHGVHAGGTMGSWATTVRGGSPQAPDWAPKAGGRWAAGHATGSLSDWGRNVPAVHLGGVSTGATWGAAGCTGSRLPYPSAEAPTPHSCLTHPAPGLPSVHSAGGRSYFELSWATWQG